MSVCSVCRTVNRPGAQFCRGCGAAFPSDTLRCPECAAPARPGARYCAHCGQPLGEVCGAGHLNRRGARFCAQCGARLAPAAPQPPQPPPQPPQPSGHALRGRYASLTLVKRGGMGSIYRALDLRQLGQVWAVKELDETGPDTDRAEALKEFRREAQILMTLSHPHLPKVIDLFEEGGKQYLVMEFIEGDNLLDVLAARRRLDEDQIVRWAQQLCDVLAYLHRQQPPIIYRDLKPQNIMVVRASGAVKLIDFGIARFHRAGQKSDTRRLGTPGYAAPEQYGAGQSDGRADIYALGITLHQLLTGEDPTQRKAFSIPVPVTVLRPGAARAWDTLITRATQPKRDDRYQTIDDLRAALPALAGRGGGG